MIFHLQRWMNNSLPALFLAEQIKKLCHTERMFFVNEVSPKNIIYGILHSPWRIQNSLLTFFLARQYLMGTSFVFRFTLFVCHTEWTFFVSEVSPQTKILEILHPDWKTSEFRMTLNSSVMLSERILWTKYLRKI